MADPLHIFLCGDVMTGRGVDQILPHPGDPTLHESFLKDARDYVTIAERAHGRLRRGVNFDYIWGEALPQMRQADLRIINLETSITTNDEPWPGKGINYRMHPDNVGCISAAQISCCGLANNHVIDWGYKGLSETLQTLAKAGISQAGAGRNVAEAAEPARLEIAGKGRVLVFAVGSTTSGIPWQWKAETDSPGVNLLKDLTNDTARELAQHVAQLRQPGDVVIVSIHWGGNWGHEIPAEQTVFAHTLIDGGIDVVYGHSSHHFKAMELYHDRLILYGCGDFLNDYEGIGGHEEFRSDLTLMYFLKLAPEGNLIEARLVPMQIKHFRLNRARPADTHWIAEVLNQHAAKFDTAVQLENDQNLLVRKREPS